MGMISDPETIKKNENLRVFISYKPLIESSLKKANDKTKPEKSISSPLMSYTNQRPEMHPD